MIKNDWIFLHISKKLGLKISETSVFGAVNGQPLCLSMAQGYTSFSIAFTLSDATVPKVSKEVLRQFSNEVKKAGQVVVEDNVVLMKSIHGGLSKEKALVKLEGVINWWTTKLRELGNFDIEKTDDIVLYNGKAGPRNDDYKNSLEIKLKKILVEKPVDNYSGFLNGGFLALLASVLIGAVFGVIQHKTKFGVPFIDIMVVLGVLTNIYKKFSNGFNKDSWKYVIPLFIVCAVTSQVAHIATVVWFKAGAFDVQRAIDIFLKQFKLGNKYAGVVVIIILQLVFALFHLKKQPERLEVEEGYYPNEKDEEWANLVGNGNTLVMKYFALAGVLCVGSIFLAATDILHNVSFSHYYGHIIGGVIGFPLSFYLFVKVYRKIVSFSPFKRHERQKKADFIAGHVMVYITTFFMAFAVSNFGVMANVYLDPFEKVKVEGTLLEDFPNKWNACRELKIRTPDSGEIMLDFCKKVHCIPKKGEPVSLLKGKGLFYIHYYMRGK